VLTSLGNYATSKPLLSESGYSREIRHPWGIADALTNLGCLFRIRGEYATAQAHFEESLQVYREQGRNIWEIDVLCAMAENEIIQGDFSSAHIHIQAANSRLGASENKWLHVLVCYLRGLLAYYEDDLEQAAMMLEQATTLAREGQFKPDLARSLMTLGRVRIKLGEIELATELIKESLSRFQDIGNKLGIATALEALASLNLVQGNFENAVKLFAAADCLRKKLGTPLPPVDRPAHDSAIDACRIQLGEQLFTHAWVEVETRSIEAVAEEVLKADWAN
jgi:tetratricopeptide (TPR) repeat protein